MEMILPLVVLIFSAILHEVMHGFVAEKLGDPTARLAGRLTLNPIPHIDLLSSILIPLLLIISGSPVIFGAAKPVPVNPMMLKDGEKDLALVALAGPFTNILLAVIAAFMLKFGIRAPFITELLYTVVLYNLILAIVNLIPIPPLDGSKVISFLLPPKIAQQYLSVAPFGIFILFFLLLFPIGGFSLGNLIHQLLIFSIRILGV